MAPDTRTDRLVILVYADFQMLDAAGPADVFHMANALAASPRYALHICASAAGPVASSGALTVQAESIDAVDPRTVDTLLVVGGEQAGLVAAAADARLAHWVAMCRHREGKPARVASVCTGAFLLGHWGMLQGRRATTHWASTRLLRQSCPGVEVDADSLFIQDGDLWTSGGVTAGIDMCLAIVEQDLGRALATRVARQLNLSVRRQGNQSQYSTVMQGQAGRYADLVDWLRAHLGSSVTTEDMARVVCESPRSFHRHFLRELGVTPRAFLEQLRLEAVRSALDNGATLKSAAQLAGYGSEAALSKAFTRKFKLSPSQYRGRGPWMPRPQRQDSPGGDQSRE
ncbi:GlxA family transcriptional regulator [Achromobacter aloeverae]|uniref:AraC family transcriptional regulator n=1 Tax=Achromobacter aloeverae TaxID=1750518 RepID=A0A4Q1HMV5_9BURK|nr:helix-turn-helix domain-containing protein [Achromobacter aloeverae]RXN92209.1 AraC family transcriptional regulator [Achromobacter aloeverae]